MSVFVPSNIVNTRLKDSNHLQLIAMLVWFDFWEPFRISVHSFYSNHRFECHNVRWFQFLRFQKNININNNFRSAREHLWKLFSTCYDSSGKSGMNWACDYFFYPIAVSQLVNRLVLTFRTITPVTTIDKILMMVRVRLRVPRIEASMTMLSE